MYTNRKEGEGAGWQGDFVEELLVESWKRERRLVKKQKQKHGKRQKKKRHFCHGKTRKQQKQRHGNQSRKRERRKV